jgi:transcriptional regulator with XRE-family HTH domain
VAGDIHRRLPHRLLPVREIVVTPADFIAWRTSLGFSRAEAARRLGIHANSMTNYEQGRTEIPLTVALACAAVATDLAPWQIAKPKQTRKGKPK